MVSDTPDGNTFVQAVKSLQIGTNTAHCGSPMLDALKVRCFVLSQKCAGRQYIELTLLLSFSAFYSPRATDFVKNFPLLDLTQRDNRSNDRGNKSID